MDACTGPEQQDDKTMTAFWVGLAIGALIMTIIFGMTWAILT